MGQPSKNIAFPLNLGTERYEIIKGSRFAYIDILPIEDNKVQAFVQMGKEGSCCISSTPASGTLKFAVKKAMDEIEWYHKTFFPELASQMCYPDILRGAYKQHAKQEAAKAQMSLLF